MLVGELILAGSISLPALGRTWLLAAVLGLLALLTLDFALDAYVNRPGRFC